MVLYPQFYRKHGIRRIGDLSSPPFSSITALELPKESIVHHLDNDEVGIGPEPEGLLFRNHNGRVLVEHVQELNDPVGSPRPNRTVLPGTLYRDYHKRYRKMRPLHDFEKSSRDGKTLIVDNYSHLAQLHQYMRSIYGGFYKWYNIYKTVFANVEKRCEGNERQHYIVAQLPKRVPGIATLKKVDGDYTKIPRNLLNIFSQPEQMFVLEMWKWLGENRQASLINQISVENYGKVNIVWTESGSWFVMNLGTLMEIATSVELEDDEGSTTLQRRFIKMMISLFEKRTNAMGSEAIDEAEKEVDERIRKEKEADDSEAAESQTTDDTSDVVSKDSKDKKESKDIIDEESLDRDLQVLDELAERMESESDRSMIDLSVPDDPIESVKKQTQDMMEDGQLSPAQQRRFEKMIEKHKAIPNPYGDGTLNDFIKIKPEDLTIEEKDIKIPDIKGVTDESYLQSTLKAFDRKYIKEVLDKDIANCALAMQRSGIVVTDYDVEEVQDAANHYRIVAMKVNPINGEPSTIRFRMPVIDESGEFTVNNVKYRLRKQRADKPIRKVTPSTVALTSYYAKVFVDRSEKSVVNYQKWLLKQIVSAGMDPENETITDMKHTKTFVNDVKLPRIYTLLSQRLRAFTVNDKYRIYVDHTRRSEEFDQEWIDQLEKDGMTFVGVEVNVRGRIALLVDNNNIFYSKRGDELIVLGSIEDLCGFDSSKAPVEIAEFRLFSRNIPVVMALGYRFGLSRLMRILEVRPRRVPVGSRLNIEASEYAVRFNDETLIFPKDNPKAQLILAGFNRYHRSIAKYNVDSFDDPEVYENVMEENGHRIGFIRELELAMEMFVDPITLDLLKQMGEPTSLDQLLIRACELLLTDWHPDETDMDAMRIRGYERMAGAVYSEMVKGVRRFRSRGVGASAKVEVNPEAVWQAINQDPSIGQVEDSNPVHNLKQGELITYMGTGGRSTRSMVKHTRAYHKSDMGVVSEATVDSGAVGVNAYLSANPQFANLRGITDAYDKDKTGNSSMLSTSALLAPAGDMDDPKRLNFVSIQNTHVVSADGYRPLPLRTGYEKVIAHRTDSLFAHTASQNGEVIEKSDDHIKVRYKDGTEESVEIGRRYGTVSGTTVPHEVVSDLEVGSKFKQGDNLVYNKGFFEVDPLDKSQVLMKGGVLAKTAIMEMAHTYEDASVISEEFAGKMTTPLTKVRNIFVTFDQSIRNLVKVGSDVSIETILCMIEDSVTADNNLFDEESMDALKTMSTNAPTAKAVGKVERIECFYHGDLEDMSESLQAIAKASDKVRVKRLKSLGKKPTTGQVDGNVRIDKDPLDVDSMVIKVYITGDITAGVGDKFVFANQMKSVCSNVMTGINETESGVPLDALFSYVSINNRIVLSPEVIGTTTSLLKVMSKRIADKYLSKRGKS